MEWTASDDDGIDSIAIYWSPGYEGPLEGTRSWPFELTTGEENDSEWTWAVQTEDTCTTTSRIAVIAYDGRLDCNYDISDADFTAGGGEEQQMPPMRPRGKSKPVCYTESGAMIFLSLPGPRGVSLEIYDVQGRLVRVLVSRKMSEGTHRIEWNLENSRGERVPAGVYFYRFAADAFSSSGKVVVLR